MEEEEEQVGRRIFGDGRGGGRVLIETKGMRKGGREEEEEKGDF